MQESERITDGGAHLSPIALTGSSFERGSAEGRLYDLLDTLIAVRLDICDGRKAHETGAFTLHQIDGICGLLDQAILSTKSILADIGRPKS
jgi:hypothetical protein